MSLPEDEFSMAYISHFVLEALLEKLLMVARHALPKAITLLRDSPSFL